jgi:hypothetical protein
MRGTPLQRGSGFQSPETRYIGGVLDPDIQSICYEAGELTGAERETAYLLKSETMKQRLLAEKNRSC